AFFSAADAKILDELQGNCWVKFSVLAQFLLVRKSGKVLCKDAGTQTHAEDANLELSGAKRRSRAAFGSSRALESTATGTMLSARRSHFFASGSRTARPLLRPEERSRTTVASSAQPSNSSRTVPFQSPTFETHKNIPVEGGFAQLGCAFC
ncbi:unnamed protein product, partial [Coccothraustes coccothraustes]